jgi:hypothetical protein
MTDEQREIMREFYALIEQQTQTARRINELARTMHVTVDDLIDYAAGPGEWSAS